jgi:hypothetical protein
MANDLAVALVMALKSLPQCCRPEERPESA